MLPKHPLARLLCKLSLLPLAWFAFLFWFENVAIWGSRASIESPTGGTTAHLMSLINESSNPGHAPYGLHVFLAPSWLPLPQRFGELAFAGYCKGEAAIAWQAADRLVIRCADGKIKTPPTSRRGIHVEFDSRPRPPQPAAPHGNGVPQVKEMLRGAGARRVFIRTGAELQREQLESLHFPTERGTLLYPEDLAG